MTQAPDTSEVLKLLQGIQGDVQDIKISQARTEEQFKAMETQLSDLKRTIDTQLSDIRVQLRYRITACGHS